MWLFNPQRKKGISPKLQKPWHGPYLVVTKINDVIYCIQLSPRSKPKIVHHNRLWKYQGESPPTWLQDTDHSQLEGAQDSQSTNQPQTEQAQDSPSNPWEVELDVDMLKVATQPQRSSRHRAPPD